MKKSHYLNLNVTSVLYLLAISLVMTLAAGCSSNAVAPSTDNSVQALADWLDSNPETGIADCSPVPFKMDRTASGLIGPKGGVLQLNLEGLMPVIFRFPAGALKVETLITISARVCQSPYGNFMIYDCGPDGTVFDLPLEVLQPEPRGKLTASLFYFNPSSMQWELQEVSRVVNSVAVFHIYHFSKYGIN